MLHSIPALPEARNGSRYQFLAIFGKFLIFGKSRKLLGGGIGREAYQMATLSMGRGLAAWLAAWPRDMASRHGLRRAFGESERSPNAL